MKSLKELKALINDEAMDDIIDGRRETSDVLDGIHAQPMEHLL